MKQLIMTLTNKQSNGLVAKIDKMMSDLGDNYDFLLVFDETHEKIPEIYKKYDNITINANTIFDELDIQWTCVQSVFRNEFTSVLKARIARPNYKQYWYVEDDTFFNGDWSILFNECEYNDSDFITTSLRRFKDNRGWWVRDTLVVPEGTQICDDDILCGFTVIYRINDKAIDFVYAKMRYGWVGHIEILVPTLLHINGFKLNDFGGNCYWYGSTFPVTISNDFFINKKRLFYNCCDEDGIYHETCTWREEGTQEMKRKNLIYHPVKNLLNDESMGV